MSEAMRYHEETNHVPHSEKLYRHFLDFNNKPVPYKIYRNVPQVSLPAPVPTAIPALQAIAGTNPHDGKLSPAALSRLLFNSNGIMRTIGRHVFRAAACTGALYEIDLYVVSDTGVYHYAPQDHALDILRQGDFRALLSEPAETILIATGTYWRNAWKYQDRTYRHFGWDNGTIMANLVATLAGLHLPYRLRVGFVDETVQALLGLDPHREVALTLVPIGDATPPPPPSLPPLDLSIEPLSPRGDIDYPLMRRLHAVSSFTSIEQVQAWRKPRTSSPIGTLAQCDSTLDDVIARRGSSRRFNPTRSIDSQQLLTLLQLATAPLQADFPSLNEMYVIAHAVDGLLSGAYRYSNAQLDLLRPGRFREEAGLLDLGQDLAAEAAANVYFMANIESVVASLGERGYRAVQLEAGLMGGRMYLGAYALGFGATGLTFFDLEVSRFFETDKSPIFLMAFGHKA